MVLIERPQDENIYEDLWTKEEIIIVKYTTSSEEQTVSDEEYDIVDITTPTLKCPPPTPQRLKKNKEKASFNRFFVIFKKLHINIPVINALTDMSKYAK